MSDMIGNMATIYCEGCKTPYMVGQGSHADNLGFAACPKCGLQTCPACRVDGNCPECGKQVYRGGGNG